jgi:MFS transporter, DHA1 family, multidrug resistance protein
MFVGFVIFGIFQIPVALAQNVWTIFICRFLAGFFGCAPLTIVGGALADFWAPVDRGVAVSIFSGATFLGPTGGPIIGGFLVETQSLGWRWTAWITLIAVAVFGITGWIVYDESFGPVLLQQRAKKMRYAAKNW